jgi:hypothetical protein
VLLLAMTVCLVAAVVVQSHAQQSREDRRRERFTHSGAVADEGAADPRFLRADARVAGAKEAPTGFDNKTNGFDVQGPPFESLDEDTVVPPVHF